MAKSKNHTAHNQSAKAHRNGIKKPKRNRNASTNGIKKPKPIVNMKYMFQVSAGYGLVFVFLSSGLILSKI
ncbi:hypothetical protein CASFOL_021698 [Castilleja foliolosa]|uniref:60S ribosomal protein L29 n=1 Tax=Castilleja foliolosa TaxID=1961234 RepID=A0ABD3CZW3_9LAMI